MNKFRFVPRIIFEDEILGEALVEGIISLYFLPAIMRHYHIADICKRGKLFLQIVALDFDKGMLSLKDVTDNVSETID